MKTKFKRLALLSTTFLSLGSISALGITSCSCSDVVDETVGQLVCQNNSDGTVTVTGLAKYNSKITTINVPNEINGKKVSSISKGAFTKCPGLKQITLPFIGANNSATNEQALFGYVFGEENYDGCGGATWQEYDVTNGNDIETKYISYCIPMNLEKVTITNANSVPCGAFSNCIYLEDISINKHDAEVINSRAFKGCIALNDFDFACFNGVKTIESHAFDSCENFQYVTIPSTVKRIEEGAFYNCDSCTTIRIGENVEYIGAEACSGIYGAILLAKSETETSSWDQTWIDSSAAIVYDFGKDSSYGYTTDWFVLVCGPKNNQYAYLTQWMSEWAQTELTIPSTITVNGVNLPVKIIGGKCFLENEFLKHIKIEEGLEHIYANTFQGCTNLECVEFPNSLKTIESNAFSGCTKLMGHYENHQKVNKILLNNVTKIGDSAFKNCSSIQEIDLGKVETIGEEAFAYCTHLCPDTTDDPDNCLRIPDTCTSIGDGAFKYCFKYAPNSITASSYYPTVVLSNQIKHIPANCFEFCGVRVQKPTSGWDAGVQYPKQIRVSVNLNDAPIVKIDDYAFSNCWIAKLSGARKTHIEYIGDYAFYYAQPTSETSPSSQSKTDLQMDQEIKYIGEYAFAYCTTVQSLTFNTAKDNDDGTATEMGYNSLEYLGQYAFYNCNNQDFTKLDLSPCVKLHNWSNQYAQENFEPLVAQTPSLPENSKYRIYTPRYAFAYCSNLRQVYLPGDEESPAAIAGKITEQCTSFTRLPERFFEGCTNIGIAGDALTIPKQIVELRAASLNACTYLTKVFLDGNIEFYGSSIFYNNQSLQKIVAHKRDASGAIIEGEETDVTFNSEIFNNSRVGSSIYYQCYKLTNSPMPTVKKTSESAVDFNIRDNMYYLNKAMTSITIPWNAVSFGSRSFMGCENLSTITFERRTSTYGRMNVLYSYSLNGCKSLTSINLQDTNLGAIYGSVFGECNKLMEITMPKHRAITFYTKPFEGWTPSESTGAQRDYATVNFNIYNNTRHSYVEGSTTKYNTWYNDTTHGERSWPLATPASWPEKFTWTGNTATNNLLTFTRAKDAGGNYLNYYLCDDNACGGNNIHFVPVAYN